LRDIFDYRLEIMYARHDGGKDRRPGCESRTRGAEKVFHSNSRGHSLPAVGVNVEQITASDAPNR
jgi:hypothetical protein